LLKILMIEDDREMAEIISDVLSRHNMLVKNYENPEIGLSALNVEKYDLLILDLSLPNIDGLEVCRMVREKSDIPIIISSARSDMSDKSACFYMGADDYMPKPYDSKELVLRIHSVLKRFNKVEQVVEPKKMFESDEEKHEIRKNGELVFLTNAEFEIMSYLVKRSGFAVSREEILSNIDSVSYDSSMKSINVLIGRLRTKVEEDPKNPKYIISLRGIGYKLVNEV